MVNQQRIKEIASDARSSLYQDFSTTEDDSPDIIEGYCHENALKVAEFLHNNGIECIFVWGSMKNMSKTTKIDEAEVSGSIHHWVEVPKSWSSLRAANNELDVTTENIVVDPYKLGKDKGTLYVSDQLPSDYQRLEGGFIKYESWMKPHTFISLDKYNRLSKDLFVFGKADV